MGNESLVLDTNFEILIWHPSEDVQQAVKHINLEARGGVWDGDINLGAIRIKMVVI